MKNFYLASALILALSLMSCEKEKLGDNTSPVQEEQHITFVNTLWSAHQTFTETISGSPMEFEFELSMTFYSDSTGLIEQTTIKPFNDAAQFSFTYNFDGASMGNLIQTNMYGEELHPMIIMYNADEETITLTRDDYSPEEHTKYDQIYHKIM